MANPTADATVDAQLATGRDDVTDCRDLIDDLINLFVSGSISLEEVRSQLATAFPSDPSEGIHLLNYIVTDPRIPFEAFRCVIECTPVRAADILFVACRNGNLRLVNYIIEMFPTSVEHKVQDGNVESVPILFAILFHESIDDRVALTVLERLLERHPEIVRNARSSKGDSLLHWAPLDTTTRASNICRSIIHAFPRLVHERDDRGYSPFYHACVKGNLEMIIRILEKCPDAINGMIRDGYLPIHLACMHGNSEIAMLFLEKCPDSINAMTRDEGYLPLHLACVRGQLGVIKRMLKKYPDSINGMTSAGYSLLHWAAVNTTMRATNICRSIIHAFPRLVFEYNDYGNLPIHNACMEGNLKIVMLFLEKCPDSINAMTRGDHGYLPLHCACVYNQLGVIKSMLKKYPDAIKGMTSAGSSLIHETAVALRRIPQEALNVIRYLLEVDPNLASVRDPEGTYPLVHACVVTNASNLNIGIEAIASIYNAYPQALVNKEEFFRQLIGSDDCEDRVKNLLRKQLRYAEQASSNEFLLTPDENGRLPLHNALRDCALWGSIKLFVKANPSTLQRRDSSGLLPLHIACEYHDCPDVVMYLLGLDSRSLFDQGNEEGNTPLHCACRAAKYELIAKIFAQYQNLPVKRRNSDDDLPIHLLADNRDQDDDSTGYLSCLFLFLKTDPDLLLSVDEI